MKLPVKFTKVQIVAASRLDAEYMLGFNRCLEDTIELNETEMSSCCSASVSDPSGEGIEGRCTDCGEMCSIIKEEV